MIKCGHENELFVKNYLKMSVMSMIDIQKTRFMSH